MHLVKDIGYDDCMPRRLLSRDSRDYIRLEIFEKTITRTPYLTLIHCWGSHEAFKTTTANLEAHKYRIMLSDLPRTYRDAIEVTYALGYRYLWIDSLCIVQDDEEEWKREATRMGLIYGNAACTIAAMDAEDSESGFLKIGTSEKPSSRMANVLSSRAWVTQERMISPRTLSYTGNTVYWECRECDANQQNPQLDKRLAANRSGVPENPKQIFEFLRDFRFEGMETEDWEETQHEFMDILDGGLSYFSDEEKDKLVPFLKIWWYFLELYTPCKLSHESDKFLAMNGVAAITQRHTRLRNTWGLWGGFLEHELLWHVDPNGPVSKRPERWRAPSWSWASVDNGKVVNDYYKRLPVMPQLMIMPKIEVPFHTSFDQSLPIKAFRPKSYCIKLNGDLRKADLFTKLDNRSKSPIYNIYLDPCGRRSESEKHDFRPDAPLTVGSREVWCFLVLYYEKGSLDPDEHVDIRLVLESIGEEDERIMRRIGYLETRYSEMRDWNDFYEDYWWKHVELR